MYDKKKFTRVTLDFPIKLKKKLRLMAAAHEISMREIVIEAIKVRLKLLENKIDDEI